MLLTWILGVSLLVSVAGVIFASVFLFLPEGIRKALVPALLSYAAGALLGASFLGILPHALEESSAFSVMAATLISIVVFFLLEKVVIWHHCHSGECDKLETAGPLILIGDALHNFIDGLVLSAAFLVSIPLGIASAVAIVAHEIPQEVGDFVILLHSGYSRARAFTMNMISGLAFIPGALLGYAAFAKAEPFMPLVLALAAGSFIYIAMADLVPKLHVSLKLSESFTQLLLLAAGIGTILLFGLHAH
ncbi:MAG: ZIP family metal transporter [Candidatus Omnitrophota bacterium]